MSHDEDTAAELARRVRSRAGVADGLAHPALVRVHPVPAVPCGMRRLPARQRFRAVRGHQHGVLELRRAAAVPRHGRPAVGADPRPPRAERPPPRSGDALASWPMP